ncbi:MAG: CTP synthase C-terminal region-related (seleno)protein [Acidimicrobiales bacterium]
MVRIGVVGDYQPTNETHLATTAAVQHAAANANAEAEITWIGTEELDAGDGLAVLLSFDALIIAPGSPYRSLNGALAAIEHARSRGVPLLGTCGGFQHVVLEYARNVVGFRDAQHAEYDPYASTLFITPLSCSLAGQTMTVHLVDNTIASRAYGRTTVTERYYCNFGLNPAYLDTIVQAGLTVSGTDSNDEPRILELPSHPFFVATLFVPQTSSTPAAPHPLLAALVEAARARGATKPRAG